MRAAGSKQQAGSFQWSRVALGAAFVGVALWTGLTSWSLVPLGRQGTGGYHRHSPEVSAAYPSRSTLGVPFGSEEVARRIQEQTEALALALAAQKAATEQLESAAAEAARIPPPTGREPPPPPTPPTPGNFSGLAGAAGKRPYYDPSASRVLFLVMTSAQISRQRYRTKNLFAERAKPAMRTWAAGFPHVWFVMEPGPAADAELSGCRRSPLASAPAVGRPANWTAVDCSGLHEVTKPVLLVDCDNGYWGLGGPCCKCESALRFAAESTRTGALLASVGNEGRWPSGGHGGGRSGGSGGGGEGGGSVGDGPVQWVCFSDDDMYFTPRPFARWLGRHDPSVAQVAASFRRALLAWSGTFSYSYSPPLCVSC